MCLCPCNSMFICQCNPHSGNACIKTFRERFSQCGLFSGTFSFEALGEKKCLEKVRGYGEMYRILCLGILEATLRCLILMPAKLCISIMNKSAQVCMQARNCVYVSQAWGLNGVQKTRLQNNGKEWRGKRQSWGRSKMSRQSVMVDGVWNWSIKEKRIRVKGRLGFINWMHWSVCNIVHASECYNITRELQW